MEIVQMLHSLLNRVLSVLGKVFEWIGTASLGFLLWSCAFAGLPGANYFPPGSDVATQETIADSLARNYSFSCQRVFVVTVLSFLIAFILRRCSGATSTRAVGCGVPAQPIPYEGEPGEEGR